MEDSLRIHYVLLHLVVFCRIFLVVGKTEITSDHGPYYLILIVSFSTHSPQQTPPNRNKSYPTQVVWIEAHAGRAGLYNLEVVKYCSAS